MNWESARRLASEAARPLGSEEVTLESSLGRVLAVEVTARLDIPHYASSAMDGWVVGGATPGWRLLSHADGRSEEYELREDEAAPIVTGARMPLGAYAVVRSEEGELATNGQLHLNQRAKAVPTRDQHIRPTAQEARRGDVLIQAGTVMNPAHIAVAAMSGHDVLQVIRRPAVACIFTGDEVDVAGIPSAGRVRDTFGPQLPALVGMLGGSTSSTRRCPDELETTITTLRESSGLVDALITTGGTGHSSADHLRTALMALGAIVLIDSVAMRPGGPTMLAQLANGCFVVCLPGNPLAAMMGLLTVAEPLLAALSGRAQQPLGRGRVSAPVAGRRGSTLLVPCTVVEGVAVASEFRSSGMMRGLADADAVVVVPEQGILPDDEAELLPLPWRRPFSSLRLQ